LASLAGCLQTLQISRLLKKISEADGRSGVLEYGSIGVLGFKSITPIPSLQYSCIPVFHVVARRLSATKPMRLFQQPASYGLTMNEGSSSALLFCCDR